MQWIATTIVATAGVFVAVAAAMFSYRQNYGWKPVVLIISQGYKDHGIYFSFEFWNRRKYPIVIHGVEIKFGDKDLHLDYPLSEELKPWFIFHNVLCQRERVSLDPANHHLFKATAPFRKDRKPVDDFTLTINVYYFDPIANARKKLTRKLRWVREERC